LLSIVIVVIISIIFIDQGHAKVSKGWETAESAKFNHWMKILSEPISHLKKIKLGKTFSKEGEVYLFPAIDSINSLTISGTINLNSETSLVRAILVDDDSQEHLVYEVYPRIVDSYHFTIKDVCEETCLLESEKPYLIRLDLVDASIRIDDISFLDFPEVEKKRIKSLQKQIKMAQNEVKIRKIRDEIKIKNLKWLAGETSISQLTYEEKKKLFSQNKVPNLQGAEYYKGGIFEIKSGDKLPSSSDSSGFSLVESFDWRNRHGASNPASPYYDGDPTGSGWITPVKSQGCNHHWAFSPLHATEAFVNLYFNQHLDLDLSEQDVASCGGGNIGCCEGGYIGTALNYIINTGVVDETCFPYSASCESCTNSCFTPNELIKIGGKLYPGYQEEEIKWAIIDYGPITCGISSWWHFMVLVGFDKDPDTGETIWIFKNSWGTGWGDNGYGYLKVELNDLYGKYALLAPVTSLATSYNIGCYDMDGDGYYNWGISHDKPPSCPESRPEKDCDDSNPSLGPFGSDGQCITIIDPCECDFEPAESDGDVDGSDLATYAEGGTGISLIDFAAEFGRTDCP
jgi:C1A family cysteine protease